MKERQMVYILDDDAGVRKSLAWMLKTNGLDATAFELPTDFLQQVEADCPSCLILDMQMPGISGLDVLNEMTAHPGTLMPVIVLTGSSSVSCAVQSLKRGAFDFLEKPINHEILLQTVRGALSLDAESRIRAEKTAAIKQRIGQLTEREREVLSLLCEGCSTKQMAVKLNISAKTVSIHRWHLMRKMQVRSATEAMQLAVRANAA